MLRTSRPTRELMYALQPAGSTYPKAIFVMIFAGLSFKILISTAAAIFLPAFSVLNLLT